MLLQVTEQEFVAGFDSVYSALIPVAEWVADLPEGAFSDFENRGAVIAEGEFRASTLQQLQQLQQLLNQILEIGDWTDDNQRSATHGQAITCQMMNMCQHSLLICQLHFSLGSVC